MGEIHQTLIVSSFSLTFYPSLERDCSCSNFPGPFYSHWCLLTLFLEMTGSLCPKRNSFFIDLIIMITKMVLNLSWNTCNVTKKKEWKKLHGTILFYFFLLIRGPESARIKSLSLPSPVFDVGDWQYIERPGLVRVPAEEDIIAEKIKTLPSGKKVSIQTFINLEGKDDLAWNN